MSQTVVGVHIGKILKKYTHTHTHTHTYTERKSIKMSNTIMD